MSRSGVPAAMRVAMTVSAILAPAGIAAAQPASQPSSAQAVEWLRVRGDRVNLRARPDRNATIVAVASDGDILECVGGEFGWRAVVPPAGVFSYVAAEFVELDADGRGRVKVEAGKLRVRVGSRVTELDPLRSDVQTWLANGAEVRVIERGEKWLKIEPPDDVVLYVADEYVAPASGAEARQRASRRAGGASGVTATAPAAGRAGESPQAASWGGRLEAAEAAIAAEMRRSAPEREWDAHLARMRELAAQRDDPLVAQLAAAWVDRINDRVAEQALLRRAAAVVRQSETESASSATTSRAPSSGPADEVHARGVLLPSAVVGGAGGPSRYRLVEPVTRRLEAYVEFDPGLAGEKLLRRYVEVRGRRRYDPAAGADVIVAGVIEPVSDAASQPASNRRH